MGLNIVQENTGSYDPYIKWNGKAGRFYIKQDEQEVEVVPDMFVLDLENIKTGWLFFAAGLAPDKVWDKSLTEPTPRPSENHKRGFSVRLFSKKLGGIFELSGSSMHLNNAINEMYELFEANKGANAGKVPVIKFDGALGMKDKHGTNYKPKFSIEKWIDRPDELKVDTNPAPQAAPAPIASSVSEF
jgi:hypothetical protein